MPVIMNSFLLPVSPSIPFLLEDTYLKGGFRVVDTFDALAKIAGFAKKVGMLSYVVADDKYYKLLADKVTWEEFKLGSDAPEFDLGDVLSAELPILIAKSDDKYIVGLHGSQKIPTAPGAGYQLFSGANGTLLWVDMSGTESRGVRVKAEYEAVSYMQPGESHNFSIVAHATLMLIDVTLNAADVDLKFFESPARTDANPYNFVSTADMLSDKGIQVIDGKNVKYRRYSFLATADGSKRIYGTFTNIGTSQCLPKVSVTYLVLE